MKKRVVIAGKMLDEGFRILETHYELIRPEGTDYFPREALIAELRQADALIAFFSGPRIDGEFLDRCGDRLRIIANFGVGYDNIDTEAAARRGIVVTNTPDPVTEPTAELAMGLMTAAARRIVYCDRALRREKERYDWGILNHLGVTLFGKQLGIIGMGRIGQALARRAVASGMRIAYHNRRRLDAATEARFGARYLTLEELLRTSDVVSLNAPASPDTRRMIGARELARMKPTALLVNTARGSLVDEQALIEALRQGVIAGAALDVYEKGDGQVSPELLTMENTVCVPHIGTQTTDTRIEMARYASENILRFFKGEPLLSPVNRPHSEKSLR